MQAAQIFKITQGAVAVDLLETIDEYFLEIGRKLRIFIRFKLILYSK